MANTKNAEKRRRQSLVRRQRNRSRMSRLRLQVKRVRQAVEAGDAENANTLLPATLRRIDQTMTKGTLHPNAAARSKSRLVRAVRSLEEAAS